VGRTKHQGNAAFTFLSNAKSAKKRLDFPKSRPRFARAFRKSSAHRGIAAEIGKADSLRALRSDLSIPHQKKQMLLP